MDWEGKVGSPQPQCAASGRPLHAGEAVFGVLVQHEGRFVRHDISAEAWPGYDRAQALSWWRRTVPEPEHRQGRIRLDPAALGRIFADLDGTEDAAKQAFRYIVALCLTRARKLHLERIDRDAAGAWLVLVEKGGVRHRVRDPGLKPEDEAGLTDQLVAVAEAGGGEGAAPA